MGGLNSAFYFVLDKIVSLQGYFMEVAHAIARVVLLIAICMAAFNHAINGTGLRENVIKISKAVIFYSFVIFFYPNIVSWITTMSFDLAHNATYPSMQGYIARTTNEMKERAIQKKIDDESGTFGDTVLADNQSFFDGIINTRTFITENGKEFSYSTIAPSAALGAMMLVAGECMSFADKAKPLDFGKTLKGFVCAALVIIVGIFAVLEYLIAYIEFMFVSSVGIILFPLSLWEGTKFMAEKYIGAMMGFFLKLLFCTICIFILLYGSLALARSFTEKPFTGLMDEIVFMAFSCLIFFVICKSAPGLAQSLMSGSPSLSAAGAIRTVAAGVGGAVAAGHAIRNVAGKAAKLAPPMMSAASTIAKAGGAAFGALESMDPMKQASFGQRADIMSRAFSGSVRNSIKEGVVNKGGDLTRSLLSKSSGQRGYSQGLENPHTATQQFLAANSGGREQSLGGFMQEQSASGRRDAMERATGSKKWKANHEDPPPPPPTINWGVKLSGSQPPTPPAASGNVVPFKAPAPPPPQQAKSLG